jgi:cephalosporin-C deacetylase-like acetyl esterase
MIGLIAAATAAVLLQAPSAVPTTRTQPPGSPRSLRSGFGEAAPAPAVAAAPAQAGAPPAVQMQPAGVTVRQLTYAVPDGTRNAATLVTPAVATRGPHPAILYLHWYEPPRPTSNRTEFLAEAVDLAASGVVSLLVDTPWTAEGWFQKRDAARDYEFTLEMEKNVHRALDVLLAQPDLDKTRVAIVGHDFGAMWGALAAADDPRVTHLVFMAGSPSFSDWYLFAPRREGAERDAFVAKLAPLAPQKAIVRFSPRPVLLQFGTNDKFIKNEDATAMAEAIPGPKTFKTYDFEHELSYQARVDRLAWLREQFKLPR